LYYETALCRFLDAAFIETFIGNTQAVTGSSNAVQPGHTGLDVALDGSGARGPPRWPRASISPDRLAARRTLAL